MAWAPFAVMAAGSLIKGSAESNAANYNADVSSQNAAMTRSQGAAAVEKQRRENERALGSIKASYGASGVTMDGSPMDVFASSAAEAELDAQNTAYNYEVKARGYDSEATLSRSRAKSAATGAVFSAAGQLLGGFNGFGGSSDAVDPRAAVRGQRGY